MTPPLSIPFWLATIGLLAVQVGLVLLAAGAIESRLSSPRLRRSLWLTALAGAGLLLANSLTGVDREIASLLTQPRKRAVDFIVRSNLAGDAAQPPPLDANAVAPRSTPAESHTESPRPEPPAAIIRWPAWLWIAGALLVALRAVLPRLWLTVAWRRLNPAPLSPDQRERVAKFSRLLGLMRPVRIVVSPKLAGPIAYGVVRPTVALPTNFSIQSSAGQDVMLAHELAHLAARDPLWLGLVDALAALLWWHPLVWWARRRLRAVSESVADEASLLIDDGPTVLASCLVELAARWKKECRFGSLGMAGFHSGLGRRVERLLHLGPNDHSCELRRGSRLLAPLACGVLVSAAAALPFCVLPGHAEPRENLLKVVAAAIERPASTPVTLAQDPPDLSPVPQGTGILVTELGNEPAEKQPGIAAASNSDLPPTPATDVPSTSYGLEIADGSRTPPEGAGSAATGNAVSAAQPDSVPATELLRTRVFRVSPNSFQTTSYASESGGQSNLTAFAGLVRSFRAAGLEFEPTAAGAAGAGAGLGASSASPPSRRSLIYNDQTGILFVRATEREMETVEQVLQVFNSTPPQVLLEVKFVEITGDDSRTLGFDWFLGEQPSGAALQSGTNSPVTLTGIMDDSQLNAAVSALQPGRTNEARELRGDQLDWPGRQSPNAGNIRVTAAVGTSLSGILTDPQFRVCLRALEQRTGVDVLTAPRVTTLSGRQAQIQVADVRTVITGVRPEALQPPGPTAGTNNSPFLTAQVPVGPLFNILPSVSADGRTIQLDLAPSITEFLGYDTPPKGGKVRVWQNGKSRQVAVPLPRFRVRQLQMQTSVPDGQTVVLGGLTIEEETRTRDKVPILGDIPIVGGMFRHESKGRVRKQLLVFVTPTLIDPAGNPVQSAANRP